MGKKVYAIKEGFDAANNIKIQNKIVNTWAECLKYVKGVKGAQYKSFESMDSAEAYLNEGGKMLKKSDANYPKDCLHIYVDGSYNIETEKYAYGLVAVRNNVVEYIESAAAKDKGEKNIRQIAGELEAAVKAVKYAFESGEKKVVIFHDYEGIAHHATGDWQRREESSINYYNKMNELMKKGIEVIFVKVDSHTGDFFNELVDEKCKEKVKLASDKVVQRWLSSNKLKVLNEGVKEEILKVAKGSADNIEVVQESSSKKLNIYSKYDGIISKYKSNEDEGINLIEALSSEEKTKFIIYLLEN